MINYKNLNLNPKGRKTCDCATRALALILDISWQDALKLQFDKSMETFYGLASKETIEAILKDHGYIKMKQPKRLNGKKFKVKELDEIIPKEDLKSGVFVTVARHSTVIKNGYINDIWNCSNKTVSNYFIKKN